MSSVWGTIRGNKSGKENDLEEILAAIEQLSNDKQAELVRTLLNTLSLPAVFKDYPSGSNFILPIDKLDRDTLARILESVAAQIESTS